MINRETLKKLVNTATSGEQILRMVQGKANVVTYTDLANIRDINQILDPYGACFLLYQTYKKNYGHWCAIMKRGNVISVFDSYGIIPDDELKWTKSDLRKVLKQDYPHLTALLYNSGKPIEYNDHPLQARGSVKTCGRWSAARLLYKNIDDDAFAKLFSSKYGYTADEYVTLFTEKLLKIS